MSIVPAFAFVLVLLALGRALRWRGLVPDGASDALNSVVLYVCLPASILLYAPKLRLTPALFGVALVPWLLLAITVPAVLVAARRYGWARADTAVTLLQSSLGNTSFLAFALIPVLAGPAALRYAVVYDQFGSFLMLSTFGLSVIAAYGGGERPRPAAIARRVLTFPPFLTLVAALTLVPATLPAPIESALKQLAGALLPLVGLAIGMQLKLRLPRRQLGPLALGLVLKLLVVPAAALGLCALFGLDGDARAAVVLESAMPPMITSAALAAMAGLAPELGAALVGYGIVASTVTLPLWNLLLR